MDENKMDIQEKGIVIFGLSDEQAHFAMKNICEDEKAHKRFEERKKKDHIRWCLRRLGK